MKLRHAMALLVVLAACGLQPGALRFENDDTHWLVDDRAPSPEPRSPPFYKHSYRFEAWFYRPVDWALEVPERRPARNVNALGEVPDSAWFTNRIGVRDMTTEEIRRGPNRDDGPVPPWRVDDVHPRRLHLRIHDARGVAFIVKLEEPARPELSTSAGVISQRVLWASGYNVPEDSLVYFEREQLVIASDDDAHEVDEMLSEQRQGGGGRFRALASRLLDGEPIGPYAPEGTRRDDPNDVVPHEHRRDLRGQYVFFAWLAHTDVEPGNRLDMWVEDPQHPGSGHLVHYLLDFDKSLGVFPVIADQPWDGHAHVFDYGYTFASMFTLGLWPRLWERLPPPPRLRGVGRFEAEHFVPHRFAIHGYHAPFLYKDELDCFWAAKILMRFRPEHIRAVVEGARDSDQRSTEYMVRTLLARQRKTGRHWFTRVNPLDEIAVVEDGDGLSLCATDLLLHHHLDRDDERRKTRYDARAYDWRGRRLVWHRELGADAEGGRLCLDRLPTPREHGGYVIVGIRTIRGTKAHRPVWVHLARDPGGRLRVIGIDRGR